MKTITVNKADLSINKTRKRSQRQRQRISPIRLKEKFVKKVRELQNGDRRKGTPEPGEPPASSEFQEAMGFLNNLDTQTRKVEAKQPLASGKQPLASGKQPLASGTQPLASVKQPLASGTQPSAGGTQPLASVKQPLASVKQPAASGTPTASSLKPAPPFSSLKNTGKPTYREWRAQTMKRHMKMPQKVRLDTFESRDEKHRQRQTKPMKCNRRKTVKLGKHQGKVSLMIYGNRSKLEARGKKILW